MAMDWHEEVGKLFIFDTYKEQHPGAKGSDTYDIIGTGASNENFLAYSSDTHSLMHIYRDKYRESEQVFEDYKNIGLSLLP